MDLIGVKSREYICGIFYSNIKTSDVLANINQVFNKNKKASIYFLNADCVNKAHSDIAYKNILSRSSMVLGDGIGIKLATSMKGGEMIENLNGTDLLPHLCEYATKNKKRVYLLGAKTGVAELMKKNLEAKYRGIEIVGFCDGFFKDKTESEALEEINFKKADIVLVAMGVPVQEKWISANRAAIKSCVVIGVGGLFDFYSGNIDRAPAWVRAIGMEWLFRLFKEPGRLWKRYIIGNPVFLIRAAVWAFKRKSV